MTGLGQNIRGGNHPANTRAKGVFVAMTRKGMGAIVAGGGCAMCASVAGGNEALPRVTLASDHQRGQAAAAS